METIYFLLIVAAFTFGGFLVVHKINARSYLHGSVNEALEYRRALVKAKESEEQPVNCRERKYVDWYLENGHKRQDVRPGGPVSKPSAIVGVAFITNDFGQHRRASNG